MSILNMERSQYLSHCPPPTWGRSRRPPGSVTRRIRGFLGWWRATLPGGRKAPAESPASCSWRPPPCWPYCSTPGRTSWQVLNTYVSMYVFIYILTHLKTSVYNLLSLIHLHYLQLTDKATTRDSPPTKEEIIAFLARWLRLTLDEAQTANKEQVGRFLYQIKSRVNAASTTFVFYWSQTFHCNIVGVLCSSLTVTVVKDFISSTEKPGDCSLCQRKTPRHPTETREIPFF